MPPAVTSAEASAFKYQLAAVEELRKSGADYCITAMAGAVDQAMLARLFPEEKIEWEYFWDFGKAARNLKRRGVKLDRD